MIFSLVGCGFFIGLLCVMIIQRTLYNHIISLIIGDGKKAWYIKYHIFSDGDEGFAIANRKTKKLYDCGSGRTVYFKTKEQAERWFREDFTP